MPTEAEFFGGSNDQSISSSLTINHKTGRLQSIEATVAALDVLLPDARNLKEGGPALVVWNKGATNSFTMKDNAGGTLATIAAGDLAKLWLLDNSTQAGAWRWRIFTPGSAQNPPPAENFYMLCGADNAGHARDVEEYNPQSNAWTTKTDSSEDHAEGQGFRIGPKANICGTTSVLWKKHEQYDPDTWTSKADMLGNGDWNKAGARCDGKGYIYSRTFGQGGAGRTDEWTDDTWTGKTDTPTPKEDLTCTSINDAQLYAFGGSNADTLEYDPDTHTSKQERPNPYPDLEGSFLLSSLIYVIMGHLTTQFSKDVDRYDPSGDSWVAMLDFPNAGRDGGGCSVANSKGYYMVGRTAFSPAPGTFTDESYEYVDTGDTWTTKTDAPYANSECRASTGLNI